MKAVARQYGNGNNSIDIFKIASIKRESEEGKGDSYGEGSLCGLPLDEEYSAVPHFRNFPEGRWWHSRRRLGAIIAQISRVYGTSDGGIPRRREPRSTLLCAAPQVKY